MSTVPVLVQSQELVSKAVHKGVKICVIENVGSECLGSSGIGMQKFLRFSPSLHAFACGPIEADSNFASVRGERLVQSSSTVRHFPEHHRLSHVRPI